MLTQFGQGTTSGKFSMRAFNGEGEINAVKLLIDGVPSNSNDGNMPYIDLAPRLDIESIEVVRGTNDPRYGLHNIAGNANISTKRWQLPARAGHRRQLCHPRTAGRGRHREGRPGPELRVSLNRTDGYRDHANAESGSFSGKWFFTPQGGTSRFGLIARHYTASAEEAGYLTRARPAPTPTSRRPTTPPTKTAAR
jgi:iron complex outermembrane receptor protein